MGGVARTGSAAHLYRKGSSQGCGRAAGADTSAAFANSHRGNGNGYSSNGNGHSNGRPLTTAPSDWLVRPWRKSAAKPYRPSDDELRLTEDLHLDSLGRVQLAAAIEERLGIATEVGFWMLCKRWRPAQADQMRHRTPRSLCGKPWAQTEFSGPSAEVAKSREEQAAFAQVPPLAACRLSLPALAVGSAVPLAACGLYRSRHAPARLAVEQSESRSNRANRDCASRC